MFVYSFYSWLLSVFANELFTFYSVSWDAILSTLLTPFLPQCAFLSQIEKFGDPNGIVQFTEDALQERVYNESTEAEGPFNISLSVTRREGVMGNITVILHQHIFTICQ